MRYSNLRDHFIGVGAKILSDVEVDARVSRQHEIGIPKDMRDQFLDERQNSKYKVIYVWLGVKQDGFTVHDEATYYDMHSNQPNQAPKWRLCYRPNTVTETMREGDTLFLALHNSGILYFIATPQGSTGEQQLSWLFGINPLGTIFSSRVIPKDGPDLNYAVRFIFDELGIKFEDPDADRLSRIVDKFGMRFPPPGRFSKLARTILPNVESLYDPDTAILAWLDHEEALFRQLERKIVAARLEEGFSGIDGVDINGFLKFSLSIRNRRKSWRSHSLGNQLEAVFCAHDINFTRSAVTEDANRPDFLFPGIEVYRAAPETGNTHLTMLAAKSTCKDRWHQVLSGAAKIRRKHLFTLEPGISESQTSQMKQANIQLVVPRPIHASYTYDQRKWLWSLEKFIDHVRSKR